MRRRCPARYLFVILLFAALFAPRGAIAADTAAESFTELINRRTVEVALMHLPIDRVVLGALPVWDEKSGKLRLRDSGESFDDQRSILILHLWATWCRPCKEEFGLWKELQEQMDRQFGSDVKIVHIAVQSDVKKMAAFVRQVRDRLPSGPLFFDKDERLTALLRTAFKGRDLPTLPMTLWLGPARIVKQVLVGTVGDRRPEVMESTERLLRSLKYLRDATRQPLPKQEDWDVFTRTGPCACPCVYH